MSAAMALLGAITLGDHRLMYRVNQWRAPRWVRLWMLCATRGGDGWIWYPMAAVLLAFGGQNRYVALSAAGLAAGAGIAIFLALKKITKRRRPNTYAVHAWADLLPPDQFSFPSGHTLTAFAISVCLIHFYPGMRPGLLFVAVSIAISRVILGMHFLSDVLVGAALGAAIGYGALMLLA